MVKSIIRKYRNNNKCLFICFIDLKKAFDSVWRNGLSYKLLKSGFSKNFVSLVISMYDHVLSCVKVNGKLTKYFKVSTGTEQGCNLSPNLFNIFISDLPKVLKNIIVWDETHINCLLYADDIALLSNSQSDMQHSLDILTKYCKSWRLSINVSKCKIMICGKNR